MQLRSVGVILHRFDEGINCLILLLVEKKVQAFEIGFRRLAILNPQLSQIQSRGEPTQCKGDRKAEQDPGDVKFHFAKR